MCGRILKTGIIKGRYMETSALVNKNRINWLDMAKGYGTIAVILAHLAVGKIGIWLYTFHVPLFFFLSGYVFNSKDKFKDFVNKKTKSLLIPYFTLSIPLILFTSLLQFRTGALTPSSFITLIQTFIIQKRFSTLWFIACLFFLNIIFYLITRSIKSDLIKGVVCLTLLVIGLLYYRYGGTPLPWNTDVCFTAIIFFYGGYILKKHPKYFKKINDKKSLSCLLFLFFGIINVVCGYYTHKISGNGMEMFGSTYGYPPLTFISAFAGIFAVILFSSFFTLKPVKYIGENSLYYYAWHQTIMIYVADKIVDKLQLFTLLKDLPFGYYFIRVGQTIFIVIVLTVVSLVINKTKLRHLFGK